MPVFDDHTILGGSSNQQSSAATISFVSSNADPVNRSTYTFTNQPIGNTEADNRLIVISSGGSGGLNPTAAISSITVNGFSCTQANNVIDNEMRTSMHYVLLPTGTTANVVITWAGTKGDIGIAVHNVFTDTPTPYVSYTDGTNSASVSASFPAGSAVLGVAGWENSTTTSTTWAGLTKDLELVIESGQAFLTTAKDEFDTEQTGLTISASPSASTSETIIVAAWQP
jgi:hypothetical protein